MPRKVFERYLERDVACFATGAANSDRLIPQHRLGGMGGNRRETPSAILTFDSIMNVAIETDPWWQRQAYRYGWKLQNGDDPLTSPVWHRTRGWLMLDDEFGVRQATAEEVEDWKERKWMI